MVDRRRLLLLVSTLFLLPGALAAQDAGSYGRLQGLPITLSHAVRIVQREGEGRVVHVEFVEEHDRSIWEVNSLGDKGMFEYRVDAVSGRLIRISELPLRGRLYSMVVGLTPNKIKSAKISTAEAVSRAERDTRATAERLEIDQPRSHMEYMIVLRNVEGLHRLRIDAESGEIVFKDDIVPQD